MFKFVNFRCPIDLYNRLKDEAELHDRSVSWVIINALKKQFGVN